MSQLNSTGGINNRLLRVPGIPNAAIDERIAGHGTEPIKAVAEALGMFSNLAKEIAVQEQRLDDQKLILELGRESREIYGDLNQRSSNAVTEEELSGISSEISSAHESFIEKSSSIGSEESRAQMQSQLMASSAMTESSVQFNRRRVKVDSFRTETQDWSRQTLMSGLENGNLEEAISSVEAYYKDNLQGLAYTPQQTKQALTSAIAPVEYQDALSRIDSGEDYKVWKSKYIPPSSALALISRKAAVGEKERSTDLRDFESALPALIASGVSSDNPVAAVKELHEIANRMPYSTAIERSSVKSTISRTLISDYSKGQLSLALESGQEEAIGEFQEKMKEISKEFPRSMKPMFADINIESEKVRAMIRSGTQSEMRERIAQVSEANAVILSEVSRGDGYPAPFSMSGKMFRQTIENSLPKEYQTVEAADEAGITRIEFAQVRSNTESFVKRYEEELSEHGTPESARTNLSNSPSAKSLSTLVNSKLPETGVDGGVDLGSFMSIVDGQETDEGNLNDWRAVFFELDRGLKMPDRLTVAFSSLGRRSMEDYSKSIESIRNQLGFNKTMIPTRGLSPEKQLFTIEYLEARDAGNSPEDSLTIASKVSSNSGLAAEIIAARLRRERLGISNTQSEKILSFLSSELYRLGEVEEEDMQDGVVDDLLESYAAKNGMDPAQAALFSKEARSFENLYLGYYLQEVGGEAGIPEDFSNADSEHIKSAMERATAVMLHGRGETRWALRSQGKDVYSSFAIEKYFGNGVRALGEERGGRWQYDMDPVWSAVGLRLGELGSLDSDHMWNQLYAAAPDNANKLRRLRENLRWHVSRHDVVKDASGSPKKTTAAEMFHNRLDSIAEMTNEEFESFKSGLYPNLKVQWTPHNIGDNVEKHRNESFEGVIFFERGRPLTEEELAKEELVTNRLERLGLSTHERTGTHHTIIVGFSDGNGNRIPVSDRSGNPIVIEFIPKSSIMANTRQAWEIVKKKQKTENERFLEEEKSKRKDSDDVLINWGEYMGR